MRNNAFWKMVVFGGALPEKFDLVEWKAAWNNGMKKLEESIEQFQKNAQWKSYIFYQFSFLQVLRPFSLRLLRR